MKASPPALKADRVSSGKVRYVVWQIEQKLRTLHTAWRTDPQRDRSAYAEALEALCPADVQFIHATKARFGFRFRFDEHAEFVIRASDHAVAWFRVR